MTRRTKTYIAAEWDGDHDAVEQLHKWNNSDYWALDFVDAHEVTQARDSSLNCSIKRSLKERLDLSKTFVLIVGKNTSTVKAGSCVYCSDYEDQKCKRGNSLDFRSYIKYECDKAKEAGIKIVVLYNSAKVEKSKCPQVLQGCGKHVAMKYLKDGKYYWDYQAVKNALMG